VEEIVIPSRFSGPPGSANGGYTAGLMARRLGGPAEVTLLAPPPLDVALELVAENGGVALYDEGGTALARAVSAEPDLDPPDPVTVEAAEAAEARYAGFVDHPFPRCFGCGPQRAPGDGLRLFAGPVAGREQEGVHAAPWTPDPAFAPEAGWGVDPEIVWAALDCPSGFAVANPGSDPPIVLGQITARIEAPVISGRPHVVMSWRIAVDGRKRRSGSAVLAPDGEPLAVARALWIELRG
jgi:hypothetical protein